MRTSRPIVLRIADLSTMTGNRSVEADVSKLKVGMECTSRRWAIIQTGGTARCADRPTPVTVNNVIRYNALFDSKTRSAR